MTRRTRLDYPLLPGLRWKGKLRVLDVVADGIAVAFDAKSSERYIYDRAVLTPVQFRDWTGEDPPGKLEASNAD